MTQLPMTEDQRVALDTCRHQLRESQKWIMRLTQLHSPTRNDFVLALESCTFWRQQAEHISGEVES